MYGLKCEIIPVRDCKQRFSFTVSAHEIGAQNNIEGIKDRINFFKSKLIQNGVVSIGDYVINFKECLVVNFSVSQF